MLYFVVRGGNEHTWHVGGRIPQLDAGSITEVHADGHELEHLRKEFKGYINIVADARSYTWHDAGARLVYRVLRQEEQKKDEASYTFRVVAEINGLEITEALVLAPTNIDAVEHFRAHLGATWQVESAPELGNPVDWHYEVEKIEFTNRISVRLP